MSLKKRRILPDQYIVRQGDEANTAFLILSGSLEVQIDGKKVGKMESGEIFGELSLILGENRKASIKAISLGDNRNKSNSIRSYTSF